MGFVERVRDRLGTDKRLAGILHGGASGLMSRVVGILISLVTLPLMIRYLGPLRFGIWATISTLIAMLAVMDLGIANSLTNMISKAYADGDAVAARRYYATAFWASAAISVVLGVAAVMIWPHVNFENLFSVQGTDLAREVSLCCAVAVAFFLIGLPLNLVHRVLSGYQQTQLTNYIKILSSVFSLVAILFVVAVHGSLVTLMWAYSTALLAGVAGLNVWVNFIDRRWLAPLPRYVQKDAISELLGSGASFFVLQLAGLIVFNSDNLVIAHYLGPIQVTPYNVTWKIAGYAAILQTTVSPSLWPAYSEAYARRDFVWVRKAFWNTSKLVMGTVMTIVVAFALLGRWVIHVYAGAAAVPTLWLLLAICFWTLLSAVMDLEACLLAAVNRIKAMSILSAIAAALNLGLSIYLVQRIGSLGVILATIVSYLAVLVVPQTVISWRVLYSPPQETAKEA